MNDIVEFLKTYGWKEHDPINDGVIPTSGETYVDIILDDDYQINGVLAAEVDWVDCGDNVKYFRISKET